MMNLIHFEDGRGVARQMQAIALTVHRLAHDRKLALHKLPLDVVERPLADEVLDVDVQLLSNAVSPVLSLPSK